MFPRTISGAPHEEHLMLQFIPFEDDWDALERLRPQDLIPYRVGLLPEPASPATSSTARTVQGDSADGASRIVSMAS
jgi:hypothetical protein